MDFKDYYQILGVARGASADDIRKAYRKLARKYHPDVSKEADAGARMAEINEAHDVLRDDGKRAAYDALADRVARGGQPGSGGFEAPPGWDEGFEFYRGAGDDSHGADFSEFFESLFGAAQRSRTRNAGAGAGGTMHMRGEDHHATIEVSLHEALHGGERQFSLRALEFDADGQPRWVTRTLAVKIPSGIRPGQFIRVAGQGMPGHGDAPAGDLYLEVRLTEDRRYRVEGADLYFTLPVTASEAALGAQVSVPLPAGGTANVRVPANARNGLKLRLKGRGLPGATPGDLYLLVDIVLPPADSDAVRKAYEDLARASSAFQPRADLGV